jgi:predicted acyltransferase
MRVSTDIRRGLIYAGLIVVVAGGAKAAAAHGLIGSDWPGRATMAVMGAFLMVTGNSIPKRLLPLSACSCDPATVQQLQRRAGWTFALAGAALSIGWLVLPESLANLLTLLLAPVTVLFVVQMFRVYRADRPA